MKIIRSCSVSSSNFQGTLTLHLNRLEKLWSIIMENLLIGYRMGPWLSYLTLTQVLIHSFSLEQLCFPTSLLKSWTKTMEVDLFFGLSFMSTDTSGIIMDRVRRAMTFYYLSSDQSTLKHNNQPELSKRKLNQQKVINVNNIYSLISLNTKGRVQKKKIMENSITGPSPGWQWMWRLPQRWNSF